MRNNFWMLLAIKSAVFCNLTRKKQGIYGTSRSKTRASEIRQKTTY